LSVPFFDIVKGTRIRAVWLEAQDVGLSGTQFKVGAIGREVVGVVRHIRSDEAGEKVRLFVDRGEPGDPYCARCGVHEYMLDPKHVVEIL
jgi:hypothetical protein